MVLHLWKAARSRAHFCTLAHKHGSTPSVDGGIAAFSCAERLVTVVHVEEELKSRVASAPVMRTNSDEQQQALGARARGAARSFARDLASIEVMCA